MFFRERLLTSCTIVTSFSVNNNQAIFNKDGIEDKGVLVPLIVRSNPHGDGYEIIAEHRRKAACTWAGIEEVPVILSL